MHRAALWWLRARKLAHSLARPALWPALRQGVAPSLEHSAALRGLNPALVLDVGANRGQFALFILQRFPSARVISFEPLPQEAATCQCLLGPSGRVRVENCGLGSATATLTLHVSRARDCSSFLPIGSLQERAFPGTGEAMCVDLPVRRLDDLLSTSDLARPALLKIDVQGYELEVLKGATGLLPSIDVVYAELSSVTLYEGQPDRAQVDAFLVRHGFRLRGEFNPAVFEGRVVQSDCLYVR